MRNEFMTHKGGFAPCSPTGQVRFSFRFCARSLPLHKSKIFLLCECFQLFLKNLLLGINNRCQIQCALGHLQGLWKTASDSWTSMNNLKAVNASLHTSFLLKSQQTFLAYMISLSKDVKECFQKIICTYKIWPGKLLGCIQDTLWRSCVSHVGHCSISDLQEQNA